MIVNTNPDFYKLFKSCVRRRDPSHTPAFLIIIIHEGGKPVKSETGFFWGEGVFFRCRLDLPLLYPMRGACPTGRRLTVPFRNLQGGLPFGSPAAPAFGLLYRPHPPDPLPGGKGETFSFLMQGASPLASLGIDRRGTGYACGKPILRALPGEHLLCRCQLRLRSIHNREKFLGVWGLLSRSPQRLSRFSRPSPSFPAVHRRTQGETANCTKNAQNG